jgi:hypothetical protein
MARWQVDEQLAQLALVQSGGRLKISPIGFRPSLLEIQRNGDLNPPRSDFLHM